jgi:hypothetical protein
MKGRVVVRTGRNKGFERKGFSFVTSAMGHELHALSLQLHGKQCIEVNIL